MSVACLRLAVAVLVIASLAQALPTQFDHDDGNRGSYLEDDILFTEEQEAQLNSRKAINDLSWRWHGYETGDVTIPYRFNDSIVDQIVVKKEIGMWEADTCIKFKEVEAGLTDSHIVFRNWTSCSSFVGRLHYYRLDNGQPINLAPYCTTYPGFVLHEIGHALGFYHEQDRSDRDDYVIVPDGTRILNSNNYGTDYDYTSIMHYRNSGNNTLLPRNVFARYIIGDRPNLSFMDIKLANLMYGCINKWLGQCKLEKERCWNKGYTGQDCKCVCPAGTLGERCEILYQNYQEAVVADLSEFSEVISTEGTLLSPYYPKIRNTEHKFVKVMVAPKGFTIKLTFNDFDIPYDYLNNYVRITTAFEGYGRWYGRNDLKGNNNVVEGSTNILILSYKNQKFWFEQTYRGFNATIEHVPVAKTVK